MSTEETHPINFALNVVWEGTQALAGDCNNDGSVNVADVEAVRKLEFGQYTPAQEVACDVNGSGDITPADILHLFSYLFKNGAAPQLP